MQHWTFGCLDSCLDKEHNRNIILVLEHDMPAVQRVETPSHEVDTVQAVLDAFGGQAIAALRSVIADAEFLCDQLETASRSMSLGIGRGWKPRFQRGD